MTMPHSTPRSQGVDARGLLALLDELEVPGHGLHSLMVARHGHVIAEGWWTPYARDRGHLGYSLSKSFTSTVLGHLAGQGVIDLDQPALSYLTNAEAASDVWCRVTVRDCITMAVGHSTEAWPWFKGIPFPDAVDDGDPLLPTILQREPDGQPGQIWAYNQVATYLVAQVIATATGAPLTAHVRRLLLDPFGDLPAKAQRTPHGRDLGFSGLMITTPAILALAQTWLDGGVWQGRRIVPDDYATLAPLPTAASLRSDEHLGYGHSFWTGEHGYRADGAFGQLAVVLPEEDLVIAVTSETEDPQRILDALWRHVLPAVDVAPSAVADDELAQLAHPPLAGGERRVSSPLPRDPASQLPAAFAAASLDVASGEQILTIAHPSGDLITVVGDGSWRESHWSTPLGPDIPVAASGAWNEGVFTAHIRLVETPHTVVVRLDPEAGSARLDWRLMPLTGPDPLATAAWPF